MPYGISKKKGGDSKKNEQKMERCVSAIMSKQKVDKQAAIRICKSSLFGKR